MFSLGNYATERGTSVLLLPLHGVQSPARKRASYSCRGETGISPKPNCAGCPSCNLEGRLGGTLRAMRAAEDPPPTPKPASCTNPARGGASLCRQGSMIASAVVFCQQVTCPSQYGSISGPLGSGFLSQPSRSSGTGLKGYHIMSVWALVNVI